MVRLNQIIAIEKGTKSKATRDISDTHHMLQKVALLTGISRTYQPDDEENGEKFPAEQTRVQVQAEDMIRRAADVMTELFDITATKDEANTGARADVMVDGKVLLEKVPVTTLLFLEKQLTDLHTFIKKLPVLDPSEVWRRDPTTGCYATDPAFTVKTKKVPRTLVKAPATDKHPAQVDVFHEDIKVGQWKTIKFSGALPQDQVNVLLSRVEQLQKAVKFAREEANSAEVSQRNIGKQIFGFLFNQSN